MKSWKTTIVSAVMAVLLAVQAIVLTDPIDWKLLIISGLIALFGAISKDMNVTGGTIDNNKVVPDKDLVKNIEIKAKNYEKVDSN